MSKESTKLVNNYLNEVKEELPDWLKEKKGEIEDILAELKSHIYDSACEIDGSDEPGMIAVQKAINKMGSAKEIARPYKKRGTPKYYITEELWEYYTKVNSIVLFLVLAFSFLVNVFIGNLTDPLPIFISTITTTFSMYLIFFLAITGIFVYLSTEGYLPEDFDKNKSKKRTSADKLNFYNPGSFLFGGIAGMLFGIFLVLNPFQIFGIQVVEEIKLILVIAGILTIIQAVLSLMKIQSRDPGFHLVINSVDWLIRFPSLALAVYIYINRALIVSLFSFIPEIIVIGITILGVIGTAIDIITRFYYLIKLYQVKISYANAYPTN